MTKKENDETFVKYKNISTYFSLERNSLPFAVFKIYSFSSLHSIRSSPNSHRLRRHVISSISRSDKNLTWSERERERHTHTHKERERVMRTRI